MNRKLSIALFSLFAFVGLFLIQSCATESLETLGCDQCDTTNVTFTNDIFPLFQASCGTTDGACHGDGSGRNFLSDYTGIKAAVDFGSIEQRVLVVKDMPKSGALCQCDLDKIRAWIDQGAPAN